MKSSFFKFSVRDIAEIGVLCALALILNNDIFEIPIGSTGGSISLAPIPLFFIAFRLGWFKGLVGAGLVYGFTAFIYSKYQKNFSIFFLEYFLAYGSICIAGLFGKLVFKNYNKKKPINYALSILFIIIPAIVFFVVRQFASTLSSIINWETDFIGGFTYNISYVLPTAIVAVVVLVLLLPTFKLMNKINPSAFLKEALEDEEDEEDEINENE